MLGRSLPRSRFGFPVLASRCSGCLFVRLCRERSVRRPSALGIGKRSVGHGSRSIIKLAPPVYQTSHMGHWRIAHAVKVAGRSHRRTSSSMDTELASGERAPKAGPRHEAVCESAVKA